MSEWPPIHPDDPPDTRNPGEPWHHGLMMTQARAIKLASALFPNDMADGSDCKSWKGEPCRLCAERNENWINTVRKVRLAMMEAFK